MTEDIYDCGNCVLKNVSGKLWCNDECLRMTDRQKSCEKRPDVNIGLSVWDFMGYDR